MGDPSPPLYETVAYMIGYKFTRGMHNQCSPYTVHICVQHLILDIIIQKFSLFHRQNTFMVYYVVLTVHVAATKSVLLLVVEKNVG